MKKIILILLSIFLCSNISYAKNNIDTKIGQMIIVGFDGNTIKSKGYKKAFKQIKKGSISGVILFSKNIKSKQDLISMNEKMLSASNITPFISIDNEGGEIERYDFKHIKSAEEIANISKIEAIEEYSKMAKLEQELKFNLNFAPCVDLNINKNSIIAKKHRSYGTDYNEVSAFARIFVNEHNKLNIATSIKHFPGHGSVESDTHKGFSDATNTYVNYEIMPYSKLKDLDELNMVMVSHIFNSNFDEKYPASLSKKTIDILKNEIGYKGIIVSDDYDMRAISDNYTLKEVLVNSINSGINLLIFSNNIKSKDKNLPKKITKIIKKEIKNGNIDEKNIIESYKKIIDLKSKL